MAAPVLNSPRVLAGHWPTHNRLDFALFDAKLNRTLLNGPFSNAEQSLGRRSEVLSPLRAASLRRALCRPVGPKSRRLENRLAGLAQRGSTHRRVRLCRDTRAV